MRHVRARHIPCGRTAVASTTVVSCAETRISPAGSSAAFAVAGSRRPASFASAAAARGSANSAPPAQSGAQTAASSLKDVSAERDTSRQPVDGAWASVFGRRVVHLRAGTGAPPRYRWQFPVWRSFVPDYDKGGKSAFDSPQEGKPRRTDPLVFDNAYRDRRVDRDSHAAFISFETALARVRQSIPALKTAARETDAEDCINDTNAAGERIFASPPAQGALHVLHAGNTPLAALENELHAIRSKRETFVAASSGVSASQPVTVAHHASSAASTLTAIASAHASFVTQLFAVSAYAENNADADEEVEGLGHMHISTGSSPFDEMNMIADAYTLLLDALFVELATFTALIQVKMATTATSEAVAANTTRTGVATSRLTPSAMDATSYTIKPVFANFIQLAHEFVEAYENHVISNDMIADALDSTQFSETCVHNNYGAAPCTENQLWDIISKPYVSYIEGTFRNAFAFSDAKHIEAAMSVFERYMALHSREGSTTITSSLKRLPIPERLVTPFLNHLPLQDAYRLFDILYPPQTPCSALCSDTPSFVENAHEKAEAGTTTLKIVPDTTSIRQLTFHDASTKSESASPSSVTARIPEVTVVNVLLNRALASGDGRAGVTLLERLLSTNSPQKSQSTSTPTSPNVETVAILLTHCRSRAQVISVWEDVSTWPSVTIDDYLCSQFLRAIIRVEKMANNDSAEKGYGNVIEWIKLAAQDFYTTQSREQTVGDKALFGVHSRGVVLDFLLDHGKLVAAYNILCGNSMILSVNSTEDVEKGEAEKENTIPLASAVAKRMLDMCGLPWPPSTDLLSSPSQRLNFAAIEQHCLIAYAVASEIGLPIGETKSSSHVTLSHSARGDASHMFAMTSTMQLISLMERRELWCAFIRALGRCGDVQQLRHAQETTLELLADATAISVFNDEVAYVRSSHDLAAALLESFELAHAPREALTFCKRWAQLANMRNSSITRYAIPELELRHAILLLDALRTPDDMREMLGDAVAVILANIPSAVGCDELVDAMERARKRILAFHEHSTNANSKSQSQKLLDNIANQLVAGGDDSADMLAQYLAAEERKGV